MYNLFSLNIRGTLNNNNNNNITITRISTTEKSRVHFRISLAAKAKTVTDKRKYKDNNDISDDSCYLACGYSLGIQ